MDEQLVTLYDDTNFRALMNEHKTLSNFEDVVKWEARAQEEIDRILEVIEALRTDILQQGKELENENNAHAQKPFLFRIFVKNKKGAAMDQFNHKLLNNREHLSEMVSQLEEAIAFTPNSLQEQMVLAEEFRQRRIALQLKKQTAPDKVDALHKSVHTVVNDGSFGTFYDPKTKNGIAQRRQIRYTKEALLGRNESVKESIDRQIEQIDHDILWAAKFTKQL